MSLDNLNLIHFVFLLLPGLWGLWVYKIFIRKSTENTEWNKDLVMALTFGIPGYLLAGHLAYKPIWTFWVAVCISVLLGSVLGALALVKGIRPIYSIANFFCRKTGHSVETPYGRGIAYTLYSRIEPTKNKKDPVSQIATVYNLSDPEKIEIGVLLYYDERHNEIVLDTRPPLTRKDIEDNHWYNDPWVKNLNLDSGVVVEIANVKAEFVDKVFDKYEEEMRSRALTSSVSSWKVGGADYWVAQASEQETLEE